MRDFQRVVKRVMLRSLHTEDLDHSIQPSPQRIRAISRSSRISALSGDVDKKPVVGIPFNAMKRGDTECRTDEILREVAAGVVHAQIPERVPPEVLDSSVRNSDEIYVACVGWPLRWNEPFDSLNPDKNSSREALTCHLCVGVAPLVQQSVVMRSERYAAGSGTRLSSVKVRSATERLSIHVDSVEETQGTAAIPQSGKSATALVSLADFETLIEKLRGVADPQDRAQVHDAEPDILEGRTVRFINVRKELLGLS